MSQHTALRARPTKYRGIQMRSRLEAGFAQMLDRCHVEWHYEPECFADETGQYMPDFLVQPMWVNLTDQPVHVDRLYLEIKPRLSRRPNHWDEQCGPSEKIIRSSEPGAGLVVAYGWLSDLGYDWEFSAPTIGVHPLCGEFYRCCAAGHDLHVEVDERALYVHMVDHPGTCPDTASRWVHGLHTRPDSAGNFYLADDPGRPF